MYKRQYYTGNAVLRQSGSGQIVLGEKATVSQGYIQIEFDNSSSNPDRTPPRPVLVSSKTAKANIFASGINTASHWRLTEMVQAAGSLVAQFAATEEKTSEQLAGEHLLACFALEKANMVTVPEGGLSEVDVYKRQEETGT